jgi:hypothetical protein
MAEPRRKRDEAPAGAGVPPMPWWATLLLWLVFGQGRTGGGGK